jgi:O-antigen biosynthesis protein
MITQAFKSALHAARLVKRYRLTGALRRGLITVLGLSKTWDVYGEEAIQIADWLDFSQTDLTASQAIHKANPGAMDIRSVTWFVPNFEHAYFGGLYTVLRLADHLAAQGVQHQFAIIGGVSPDLAKQRIGEAFPSLNASSATAMTRLSGLTALSPTDISVSTLWSTAYYALRFNAVKRKFYMVQDFEPLFYPAGATSAQVEASYRFGFYGMANTLPLRRLYAAYGEQPVEHFLPSIDTEVFYPPAGRKAGVKRVFFYGRPGHPRNAFELGAVAMRRLKARMGDSVEIVAAGATWDPKKYDLHGVVKNLGLLDYKATGDLYRSCDAGLVMMFTRHPSYLPFELMASGALVVTNPNPATSWLLQDDVNCLLSESSATCLAERLQTGLEDDARRHRITTYAAQHIRANFGNWQRELAKLREFMQSGIASPAPDGHI